MEQSSQDLFNQTQASLGELQASLATDCSDACCLCGYFCYHSCCPIAVISVFGVVTSVCLQGAGLDAKAEAEAKADTERQQLLEQLAAAQRAQHQAEQQLVREGAVVVMTAAARAYGSREEGSRGGGEEESSKRGREGSRAC